MKRWSFHGTEISYREYGSGKTLVLLHGYGGNPKEWEGVVRILSGKYKMIVPNLASLYYAPKDEASFTDQVGILAHFFKHVAEGACVDVVAASFGGTLTLASAVKHPELLHKIVLIAPMPSHPIRRIRSVLLRTLIRVGKRPMLLLSFAKTNIGKASLAYLQKAINISVLTGEKRSFQKLTERKLKAIAMILHSFHRISNLEDWSGWEARWRDITKPVLILWGKNDILFGRLEPARMRKLITHAHFHWISRAGHAAMKDNPQEVATLVKKFIEDEKHEVTHE